MGDVVVGGGVLVLVAVGVDILGLHALQDTHLAQVLTTIDSMLDKLINGTL